MNCYKPGKCEICGSGKTEVWVCLRRGAVFVKCEECGAEGPTSTTEIGAIKKWNRPLPMVVG